MDGRDLGRALLIVLLTLLSGMRLYFRYRARLLRDVLRPLAEGPFLVTSRLALGLPLLAATFLAVVAPDSVPGLLLPVPVALRVAGALVALACLAVLGWVHAALGPSFSTTVFLRPGHRLVTTGPYRRVRHPMYTAYLLYFLALLPVSGAWPITLLGAAMIGILMTVRLGREEAVLEERFGEAWRDYRHATGAFLPRRGRARRAPHEA